MKKLTKADEPEILVKNYEAWTETYTQAEKDERKKLGKWGHVGIKDSLQIETGGKCAYCEGFMSDVSYPHVEHIIPKTLRPDLAHVWTNLTLACQTCNINKGDYYKQEYSILNPYIDDPQEYLLFHGGLVAAKLGQFRGEVTVSKLELNRMELVQSRSNRLQSIRQLLERWFEAESEKKEFLAAAIVLDADEGEFSVSVWDFLNHMGFNRPTDGEVCATK